MESYKYLFREKNLKMLEEMLEHRDKTISYYSSRADLTFSHGSVVIKIFEKDGLLNLNREGRRNIISLTKKGRELAEFMKRWKDNNN